MEDTRNDIGTIEPAPKKEGLTIEQLKENSLKLCPTIGCKILNRNFSFPANVSNTLETSFGRIMVFDFWNTQGAFHLERDIIDYKNF